MYGMFELDFPLKHVYYKLYLGIWTCIGHILASASRPLLASSYAYSIIAYYLSSIRDLHLCSDGCLCFSSWLFACLSLLRWWIRLPAQWADLDGPAIPPSSPPPFACHPDQLPKQRYIAAWPCILPRSLGATLKVSLLLPCGSLLRRLLVGPTWHRPRPAQPARFSEIKFSCLPPVELTTPFSVRPPWAVAGPGAQRPLPMTSVPPLWPLLAPTTISLWVGFELSLLYHLYSSMAAIASCSLVAWRLLLTLKSFSLYGSKRKSQFVFLFSIYRKDWTRTPDRTVAAV